MNEAAAEVTGNAPKQMRALMEIFAAEGGMKKDPRGGATFGGMTQRTLDTLKTNMRNGKIPRDEAILAVGKPEDLKSPELMARAYSAYLLDATRRYGGAEILDEFRNPETSAAVADTLFMHGANDGAVILKQGVQAVIKNMPVDEQRKLDLRPLSIESSPTDTMHNLQRLDAAGYGQSVRTSITKQRIEARKAGSEGEIRRIEHFRFPESR